MFLLICVTVNNKTVIL